MIISDDPRLLFIHIPKTAGMSLMAAMSPEMMRSHRLCLPNTKHESAEAFVRRCGRSVFDSFHSFSVVRDPLDRFLSHFAYLKTNRARFPVFDSIDSADAYVDAIVAGDKPVLGPPERTRPQHRYLTSEDGVVIVDEVLRFESLEAGLAGLCDRFGLKPRPLPRENKSDRSWARASRHVDDFVRSHYRRDFELFGY